MFFVSGKRYTFTSHLNISPLLIPGTMKTTSFFSAVLGLMAVAIDAHMEMSYPPPLRSKFNKNLGGQQPVYGMNSPLDKTGKDFPCKGFLGDIKTTQPVVTWTPGQTYQLSIFGTASHGGGSCQVSLSTDGGKTFTVMHSWVGGCVVDKPGNAGPATEATAANLTFALPPDTPSGDAVMAWSWFNLIGNREMYMNCAYVQVGPGPKMIRSVAKQTRHMSKMMRREETLRGRAEELTLRADTPWKSRPEMFVANVQKEQCETIEGTAIDFPNPGPNVERKGKFGSQTKGTGCGTLPDGSPAKGNLPAGGGSGGAPPPPPAQSNDPAQGSGGAPAPVPAPAPTNAPGQGSGQITMTTQAPKNTQPAGSPAGNPAGSPAGSPAGGPADEPAGNPAGNPGAPSGGAGGGPACPAAH